MDTAGAGWSRTDQLGDGGIAVAERAGYASPHAAARPGSARATLFFVVVLLLVPVWLAAVLLGVGLGTGTAVRWVGLPVLAATTATVRGIAMAERGLVPGTGMLGAGVPDPYRPLPDGG